MSKQLSLIPSQRIEKSILLFRGERVMMDADLAELYGVTTSRLLEAVRRNLGRFPKDFMFQLTNDELENLRSQFMISSGEKPMRDQQVTNLRSQTAISSYGGRRYNPYAFTEQGVAMLSSVLRSKRAINVNIEIMRAFVRLKHMIASNVDLVRKVDNLEKKYDSQFRVVFDAIRALMTPPEPKKRQIGFGR